MKTIRPLIIFSALLFLVSFNPEDRKPGKHTGKVLTRQEMLADFEIFKAIYEQANAGLYKYHSKSDVDRVFRINKGRIRSGTSYREFYNILWNVIDYTGSCHNELTYPDSLDRLLSKQRLFFPLPLKYIDHKLYTNVDYQDIPKGSELISVNALETGRFVDLITKYISTDGTNKSGKYAKIETDWLPFYIYLALGEQNAYNLRFKDRNSELIKERKLAGITYNEFYALYKKRHSKEFEDKISADYAYHFLDSINTGLLEVHTFGMGGPETAGHADYASFLDSVFSILKNENVENLIVDIRGNGGGNDPNDLLLYSYLTRREFKENKTAFTLFQEIPFKQYYVDDDVEELTNDLKQEHSLLRDGKYYQNEAFNKAWKPKLNAFRGKIILLIDAHVASAGSLFAALFKSDDEGLVIGEESLGGYYGHTGHIPMTYELPHSKLKLTFSIVNLEQDVQPLPDEKPGDGVMPDIVVHQTYEDFLGNRDTVLNFAIARLKKR